MELNNCINFLLTKAQHTVFQYLKANLAQFDVTPVQYGILKCLWDNGEQTPKQIAEILSLDGSTISGIIDRMKNKGLIERVFNNDDRRTLNIVATKHGLELKDSIEKVVDDVNVKVLKMFSPEEKNQLLNYLRAIAQFK